MKCEADTQFILTLSKKEALWLKSIMQNPLYDVEPENEDPIQREHRNNLWLALEIIDYRTWEYYE